MYGLNCYCLMLPLPGDILKLAACYAVDVSLCKASGATPDPRAPGAD